MRSLLSKSVIIRLLTLSTLILGIGILGNTALASVAPTISITTCNELLAIDDDVNNISQNYKLANDIDCSGIANFTPIGLGGAAWTGDGYAGVFDGQNYTIRNLVINSVGVANVGLFSKVEGGTIKNLTLKNGSVTSDRYNVGGLVGHLTDSNTTYLPGRIERVCSDLNVTSTLGDAVGGIVGDAYEGVISQSCATGDVAGYAEVGGIAGYAEDVYIDQSYATGSVSGDSSLGGIVGYNEYEDVYITDSYSRSDVQGNNECGGIIGYISEYVYAYTSYYSGIVDCPTGSDVLADDSDLEVTDTFWDIRSGSNPSTTNAYLYGASGPRTTAQMKDIATYTTGPGFVQYWDFEGVWKIDSNHNDGYPQLRWVSYTNDNDDVDESVEAAAPNSGDANNDGVQDSEQSQVTSLLSSVSSKYVTLQSSTCSSNGSVSISSAESNSVQDEAKFSYPAGLLNFTLSGCAVGGTETITQYYFGDYDLSKVVVRKYNSATNEYATIESAVITSVIIGGQAATKVTYQVTDGGPLDQDGVANGTIVDPAGLAVLGVTSPNTGFEQKNQIEAILMIGSALALVIAARFYGKRQVSKK